jgi:tetratricopeptide (TPR) repeat protein
MPQAVTSWLPNRKYLIPTLIALALAVLGGWRLYEQRRPERILATGLDALAAGHDRDAERAAATLSARGHADHAAYLHARIEYARAEQLDADRQKFAAFISKVAVCERLARVILARATLSADPGSPVRLPLTLAAIALVDPKPVREANERERQTLAQYVSVLLRIREIDAESPLRVEGAIIAGRCYVRLGQQWQAMEAWEFVVSRRPEHADAHRHLAAIFYDLGAMERALHHLGELARLEPEDGRPHRQIGYIWKDEKQSRLAIAAYEEALRRRLEPAARAEAIRELAEVWLSEAEANPERALAVLEQCPAGFSQHPELLTLRAEALWMSRNNEILSRELVAKALQQDPDLVSALLLIARMHLDVEEWALALPHLERARQLAPHLLPVRVLLAQTWQRLERDCERLQPLLPALKVVHEAVVRPRVQAALKARDEHQRRIEHISTLSKLAMEKPADDEVRVRIARLWLELENPLLARTWFRAALVCNPANNEARRGLEQLR